MEWDPQPKQWWFSLQVDKVSAMTEDSGTGPAVNQMIRLISFSAAANISTAL